MQSIIHADIFFFVSTIAMMAVAIVIFVILVYIAIILSDLRHITTKVKKESDEVIEDIHALRTHIKTEGLSIRYLSGFFRHMFKRRRK